MRVISNKEPSLINIEISYMNPGKSEVRVRENIHEKKDEKENLFFEYDEYIFLFPTTGTLSAEIEQKYENLLITGRNSEFNPKASQYQDAIQELDTITTLQNSYVVSYKEGVNTI